MNKRIITNLALSALMVSFVFLGAGCGKKTVIPPEGTGGDADGKNIKYPMAEGGFSQDNLPRVGTLDDKNAPLGSYADQQSDEFKRLHGRCSEGLFPIYFDFDQAGVRGDMESVVNRDAEYIKSHPGIRVTIEGNTDDRGTNEYNMALGERRALNVQKKLVILGIDARNLQTLSYGEERPLFIGQDENAYSGNRRVDLIAK
ncbi:MAG: OmpA family protein [Desulforhopalus sp.]|nr:OmpA family protein [Desulforhopalus sp.]